MGFCTLVCIWVAPSNCPLQLRAIIVHRTGGKSLIVVDQNINWKDSTACWAHSSCCCCCCCWPKAWCDGKWWTASLDTWPPCCRWLAAGPALLGLLVHWPRDNASRSTHEIRILPWPPPLAVKVWIFIKISMMCDIAHWRTEVSHCNQAPCVECLWCTRLMWYQD